MSHSITQKNINSGSITAFNVQGASPSMGLKDATCPSNEADNIDGPMALKGTFSADEQAPPKDPSVIYDKVGLID